jgi:hypothetical protein
MVFVAVLVAAAVGGLAATVAVRVGEAVDVDVRVAVPVGRPPAAVAVRVAEAIGVDVRVAVPVTHVADPVTAPGVKVDVGVDVLLAVGVVSVSGPEAAASPGSPPDREARTGVGSWGWKGVLLGNGAGACGGTAASRAMSGTAAGTQRSRSAGALQASSPTNRRAHAAAGGFFRRDEPRASIGARLDAGIRLTVSLSAASMGNQRTPPSRRVRVS